MAGISIELRRFYREGKLGRVLLAVGYSAVLGTGNWLFAILSIFISAYIAGKLWGVSETLIKYQIYITYSVSLSLILSGFFQLSFTRYISDRLFEKEFERVLPNTHGVAILIATYSFLIALLLSFFFFKGYPYYYHVLFSFTVATLSVIWVVNALLTGLKNYKHIFASFVISYSIAALAVISLSNFGLVWLMLSFYLSQTLLLFLILFRVARDYRSPKLLEFDFLRKDRLYKSLMLTGFFANLGIWIDKYVFWYSPMTGTHVLGNMKASIIYDVPFTLALISIVPGFAVAFLKIELEFFDNYDVYYKAVRTWGRLDDLYRLANKMIESARSAFFETLRFQALTAILLIFIHEYIFRFLKLPTAYIPLFEIFLVAKVFLMGYIVIYALLSYFDLRRELVKTTFTFVLLNFIFTLLTQFLGAYFYGYGYMFALMFSMILGMEYLRRFLNDVHYRTFALRE